MATRKKGCEESGNAGGASSWMVTFSDLATLLLTFFVLLLSMSSLNDRAFRSVFKNFSASSGVLLFRDYEPVALNKDHVIKDICKSLKSVYVLDIRDIEDLPKAPGSARNFNLLVSSGNYVWVNKQEGTNKFSFTFSDNLLFESGSSTLQPAAHAILDKLAMTIQEGEYLVYIDGHTDSIPIHNDFFSSNDELSLARARAVLEYFLTRGKVNPKKLAMGGYGSWFPLNGNETPETRAMNRRVEIIFERVS